MCLHPPPLPPPEVGQPPKIEFDEDQLVDEYLKRNPSELYFTRTLPGDARWHFNQIDIFARRQLVLMKNHGMGKEEAYQRALSEKKENDWKRFLESQLAQKQAEERGIKARTAEEEFRSLIQPYDEASKRLRTFYQEKRKQRVQECVLAKKQARDTTRFTEGELNQNGIEPPDVEYYLKENPKDLKYFDLVWLLDIFSEDATFELPEDYQSTLSTVKRKLENFQTKTPEMLSRELGISFKQEPTSSEKDQEIDFERQRTSDPQATKYFRRQALIDAYGVEEGEKMFNSLFPQKPGTSRGWPKPVRQSRVNREEDPSDKFDDSFKISELDALDEADSNKNPN